jgi:hypothetical protein
LHQETLAGLPLHEAKPEKSQKINCKVQSAYRSAFQARNLEQQPHDQKEAFSSDL